MKKIRISIYKLKPGMIAAADVYSSTGQLIVLCDTVFTDELIEKLTTYSTPYVTVYEQEEEKPEEQPQEKPQQNAPVSSQTYSERIKSTKEFQHFQEEFSDSLNDVNKSLQHIVTNSKEIDIDSLLTQTTKLLSSESDAVNILDLLSNLKDYDDSTYAHSLNVSIICRVFGQWLKMSNEDLDVLTVCGILHDLGKLLIPPEIIQKPGKLTPEEYEIVKSHPYLGYKHVELTPLDSRIKSSILQHHEKCNGTGYPSGLTSDFINPFAKIIAICDVYDAMTAKRVYREPICPFYVIRMFEEDGYQHFDPQYLIPFMNSIVQTYLHNEVKLNDGEIGEIIFINNHALSRPIVRVGTKFIDLSTTPQLYIEEIL